MLKKIILLGIFTLTSLCTLAEPTHITVRVLAKDAKFIGSSMDGAQITITDTSSDKTLASGVTSGSTGNTQVMMKDPHKRHAALSDETSAAYSTTLDIKHPVKAKISAKGPANLGDNASEVSAEIWLIPGKHLNKNDAIMLEIPGFYLATEISTKSESGINSGNIVTITSEIRMMCGCPIEPDGLWDANQYQIEAYLTKNGEEIARKSMKFVKTSVFSTHFEIKSPGNYEIITFAYDPETSNTGVSKKSFVK